MQTGSSGGHLFLAQSGWRVMASYKGQRMIVREASAAMGMA